MHLLFSARTTAHNLVTYARDSVTRFLTHKS
jgi:hypothetical protein